MTRRASGRTGSGPDVVLIEADSATALQLARILADRGVRVTGLTTNPGHWACRTRAFDEVHAIGSRSSDLIAALTEASVVEPGSVLIPCSDRAVVGVMEAADRLRPRHLFSDPPPAAVRDLLDKERFDAVARRNQVRTPQTVRILEGEDPETALGDLPPPWVVKPAVKDERWLTNAPNKALRLDGDRRFEAVTEALTWADELLVQEWISGPDTALVTCNCYITPAGDVEAAVVSAKLRQWPSNVGTASAAVTVEDPMVARVAGTLLSSVGFHGLGYVEFKRQGSELVAIEANVGRPTGRSVMAEAAGVDLHYALYADLAGIDRAPLAAARPGVVWVHLRRDLQAAAKGIRRGDLSVRDWARTLTGPRIEAVARWNDPVPFLADFWSTAAKRVGALTPKSGGRR